MKKHIVIVDDDPGILQTARVFLSACYEVKTLSSPNDLLKHLQKQQTDVIILDMNFTPGATNCQEGLTALKKVLAHRYKGSVIMNTAFGDIDIAVEAIKLGAKDFLVKPWDSDTLIKKVKTAIEQNKEPESSNQLQQHNPCEEYQFRSAATIMQPIHDYIKRVAPTDASILLLGENGTGKTLLAYQIHQLSKRCNGPFIKVDLGAIPETLFETELFGHVKGAYTDAKDDQTGKFELASGGTLFLDEITNLSFPLQSKILSAIQFKRISKIGSNNEKELDIRLISATNRPIYQLCDEGKFRQDLLYRVNTIEVTLPPLRERIEDITILANHFLNQLAKIYDKSFLSLSKQALLQLHEHQWPGNIRELRHAIERAVIICDEKTITPDHIILRPQSNHVIQTGNNNKIANMDELERVAIHTAIEKNGGNLSKAARDLGLGRTTLYRKIKKLDIH